MPFLGTWQNLKKICLGFKQHQAKCITFAQANEAFKAQCENFENLLQEQKFLLKRQLI